MPSPRREILSPLQPGSRTPEEFRAAVLKVVAARKAESLTGSRPGARLRSMKRRVLLAPATRSPKREAIRAAVEEVAAERERMEAEKISGKEPSPGAGVKKKRSATGSSSKNPPSARC